jgi:hypothetical protein
VRATSASGVKATSASGVKATSASGVKATTTSAILDSDLFADNSTDGYLVRNASTTYENSQIKDNGTAAPEAPSFKIGNVSGGNYTEIEADGTIKFHGNATVFRDEMNDLITKLKNNPSDKLVNNLEEASVTYKNNATTADYAVMSIQLNHDRKNGAAVYPHLHWWQSSVNMPNWLLQYRWQRNGQAKVTDWTYLKWTENAAAWVSGTLNQITRFGSITPPSGDNVSDILQIRLIRDVADASGEFGSTAETSPIDQDAVSLDVHIEVDTVGSRQEYIK